MTLIFFIFTLFCVNIASHLAYDLWIYPRLYNRFGEHDPAQDGDWGQKDV